MWDDEDIPAVEEIDTGSIRLDAGRLKLTGDIDFALVTAWKRTPHDLASVTTVEASEVTFMGSAGIALVIQVTKAAPGPVRLPRPSRSVLRPLQAMGVDQLLDVTA